MNGAEKKSEAARGEDMLYLSGDWKDGAGPKPAVFDFAEDFIIFLILLPLLLLPVRVMNLNAAAYVSTAVAAADFFLLTVNRRKAKKRIYFILFLFLITAAAAALALLFRNYSSALAALFAAPVSCKKLKDDIERHEINYERDSRAKTSSYLKNNVVFAAGATCFIAYFTGVCLGFTDMVVFAFADFAVVFAAMLIYRHRSGAYCLSQWNKTARAFGGAGYESGNRITGTLFSVLAVAAVGVLSAFVYFSAQITGASRVDYAVINFFKRINETPVQHVPTDKQADVNTIDMKKALDKYAAAEPSQFVQILGKVFLVLLSLMAAAAAVFALAITARAVLRYIRKLNENINEENRSLISVDTTVAKIKEQIRHIGRRLDIFARGGSRMKIRRLFYLHVKRHRAGVILKYSDSPYEISEKISSHTGKDIKTAAKIYEKARYGNDECTEDDVRLMKEALK